MDKEFIPYEQALALKELGFNERCFAFWDAYNGDTHLFFKHRIKYHWIIRVWKALKNTDSESLYFDNQDYLEYSEGDNCILAPTWHQAFKFFREKYKFRFNIDELYDAGCEILIHKDYINTVKMYDNQLSYEEAELQCLKKLIQIAIKKK